MAAAKRRSPARIDAPTGSPRFPSTTIQLGVIALAVVLAYATAIGNGFVWIDHEELERGGYRLTSSQDFARVWTLTLDQYLERDEGDFLSRGGYWRPIYALDMSLDWAMFGPRAWCFHVANVAWHLFVVLLLFFFARAMFGSVPVQAQAVFWGTLLFSIHPLGVHSVTWISGRKDLLCAAFGTLALLLVLRLQTRHHSAGRTAMVLGLATMAMLLALGSKELALMVPVIGVLILWWRWPLVSQAAEADRLRLIAAVGLLWLCALGVIAYRVVMLGGFGLDAEYPAPSFARNLATSALLWWHEVLLVLVPRMPLVSDTWPIAQQVGLAEVVAIAGLIGFLMGTTLGIYRRRPWAWGLVWYVVWMLPATGLVPLRHMRAERYLYPASWGLLFAVAMVVLQAAQRSRSPFAYRVATAVLSLWGIVLLSITSVANTTWKDDQTLFADAVRRDPSYVEGHTALAKGALDRGNYEQAVRHSQDAIKHMADSTRTHYVSPLIVHTNYGQALFQLGRPGEALEAFRAALAARPSNAAAQRQVGLAALAAGDLATAETHLRQAAELNPSDTVTQGDLSAVLLNQGKAREAIARLKPLVELDPRDWTNRNNLASAMLILQRYDEAEPHFAALVEAQPGTAVLLAKLAWCQWKLGQVDQARLNLEQARQIESNHPTVLHVTRLINRESS